MALAEELPVPAREIWIRQFRAAFDCAPTRTREEREQTLEQVLTKIQPGSITVEKVGPSPSQAFQIGESLYTDVPGVSGLISLAWASPYFPHVIATIGSCIAIGDDETLRPMWPGFFRILYLLGVPRAPDLSAEQYAASLTWGTAQHLLLQTAWRKWADSDEDDRGMLLGVQAYLALSRLPSSDTIDEDLVSLRNFANAMIISKMYEMHPDWGEPPQEPTAQDDVERATATRRE